MSTHQVKTEIHTLHSARSLFHGDARTSCASSGGDRWLNGDHQTVWQQIQAFLGATEQVRLRDGTLVEKKRRRDAKCLVVGTLSCPRSRSCREADCLQGTPDCERCCEATARRLQEIVGTSTAISLSLDTEMPRLRFYAAGNPKHILPTLAGLSA